VENIVRAMVVMAEGFEEIEAIAVIDILRRAEIDTKIISMTGSIQVTGAHNITLLADALYDEIQVEDIQMIILPGGMPGTTNLQSHEQVGKWITQFHQQKKWIGAICAAPSILGLLHVLEGKSATCYPGFEADLIDSRYICEPVVQDGHIITSRGAGTALLFALKLVEVIKGIDVAEDLRTKMIIQ
jgi:4-methyl-5(b-hydroxyethyl)-thiazole monophosphate biosynthesis